MRSYVFLVKHPKFAYLAVAGLYEAGIAMHSQGYKTARSFELVLSGCHSTTQLGEVRVDIDKFVAG